MEKGRLLLMPSSLVNLIQICAAQESAVADVGASSCASPPVSPVHYKSEWLDSRFFVLARTYASWTAKIGMRFT